LGLGRETLVFRTATAVALLHALDDAFLNRQPGVAFEQHALAATISLAAGVGAMIDWALWLSLAGPSRHA
jgi:hypothetical protein